jgi:hypothetical protein
MLTLEVSKEIQAVGIAFNLINIRAAHLRNEEQEKAEVELVSRTGPRIRFATVPVPSYELASISIDSRETEKKGSTIGDDSQSSV